MKSRWETIQNWIVPVALLAIWEGCGRAGIAPRYLSTPSAIVAALWELARSGELWSAALVSLYRVAMGFGLGALSGVLIGVAAGRVRAVRDFFEPLVSALYAVPKVAFLPIFLLLLGLGHASKISIIAFSVFFPVFLASRDAFATVNPIFLWAARNMGASSVTTFFRVIIPAAAPQIFSGVRIGLAHAFVLLFAAEVIGSQLGLGVLIAEGEDAARFDLMLAGIACFAILGFLGDRLLMAIRARVLRGQLIGTEESATS